MWHDPEGPVREAFIADIPREVYQLWSLGTGRLPSWKW